MQRMETLLFELNPNPMIIYDIESLKILDVNDAAVKLYGYSREEFITLSYTNIQAKRDKSALFKVLIKTPKGFENTGIWRHKTKDGTILHVELVDRPYEYDKYNAKILLIRDVSKYVEQEEELQIAQERLNSFSNNSPLTILEWTPDFHLKSITKKGLELFGCEEETLIGRHWSALARAYGGNQIYGSVSEKLEAIQKEDDSHNGFEIETKGPTEKKVFTRWHNSALSNEEGEIVGYQSVVEDLTCCRRATGMLEETLQEKDLAWQVLSTLDDMVVVLNATDAVPSITFANNKFRKITATSESKFQGKPLDDSLLQQLPSSLRKVITEDKTQYDQEESIFIDLPAGQSLWLHPEISEIGEPDSNSGHRVIIFRDVTELRIRRGFMKTQQRLLSMIAGNYSKNDVLNEIIGSLDRLFPNTKSRVTTIDEDFTHIYNGTNGNGHSQNGTGLARAETELIDGSSVAQKRKTKVLTENPLHHCWSAPIPSGKDTTLGAITVGYLKKIDSEDRNKIPDPLLKEITEYFAQMAGLAMEYGTASQTLIHFSHLVEGVAQASTHLNQCSDIDEGLQKAIAQLGQASDANGIFIVQRNQSGNEISVRQQWCRQEQSVSFDSLPLEDIGSRLHKGEPFNLDIDLPGISPSEMSERSGKQSLLIIPIETGNSPWGGLGLNNSSDDHEWSTEEELALLTFAGNISEFVQRHQTQQELSISQQRLDLALRGAEVGMWELNFRTNEYKLDNHWKEILGFTDEPSSISIENWKDRLHPEDRIRVLVSTRVFLNGEQTLNSIEQRMLSKSGVWRWILSRGKIVEWDEDGIPVRACGTYQDITDRKKAEERILRSLKEKEILLAEIHHRVKNNMAVISGLIQLQAEDVEDPQLKDILYESQMRIQSMAMIHEKLYQSAELSRIDYGEYIADLARTISSTLQDEKKDIKVNIDADEVALNVNQAIPCALILNEIITNAYKHGFKYRKSGNINISLKKREERITISVENDGTPLPSDFSLQSASTLGMTLIQTLSQQLDARLSYKNEKTVSISFEFTYHE